MMLTVQQISQSVEEIAPLNWAEEWDNCGLIVGDGGAAVAKALVTLDVTPAVLAEAVQTGCQLIISHHPPIFQPLKKILFSSFTGQLLSQASKNQLNLYAAHTNYDKAPRGLSANIARALGLQEISVLKEGSLFPYVKLVSFVPASHLEAVFTVLALAGAGSVGPYDACSFRLNGEGTFRPLAGAQPYLGKIGVLETVAEVRLEMILPQRQIAAVLQALKTAHPYETPAYDLYPLLNQPPSVGLGRIGVLPVTQTSQEICQTLKTILGVDEVLAAGELTKRVRRVAVVSGSGASLITEAAAKGAELLLTGDLKYHDYQKAAELGLNLIDAGHYHTEKVFIDYLAAQLTEKWGAQLEVSKSTQNKQGYVTLKT